MDSNNIQDARVKIVEILKQRGPSLPVHVSSQIGLEMLFASAFLSELASDKTVKISKMKVGGSPLYFLPGQETQLEKFYTYLPGKEKEAFELLRSRKMLVDQDLEPAIRVALRNLKDFAVPLVSPKDTKKLLWKFHSVNDEEVFSLNEANKPQQETIQAPVPLIAPAAEPLEISPQELEKPKPEIAQAQIKVQEPRQKPQLKKEIKLEIIKEKPLILLKKVEKPKKIKEKSDFVMKSIDFLKAEDIELAEEKYFKKKEFEAVIKVDSNLGKMSFYLIAKDKIAITESDINLALQKSQENKMPVFLLSPGEMSKKTKAFLQQYDGLIKFCKL